MNAQLNHYDHHALYGGAEQGYTDYPTLAASLKAGRAKSVLPSRSGRFTAISTHQTVSGLIARVPGFAGSLPGISPYRRLTVHIAQLIANPGFGSRAGPAFPGISRPAFPAPDGMHFLQASHENIALVSSISLT